MANLQKITLANFRQIRHFRQNCLFQGHLCHLICLENYTLANFCHIRQIGHYRQNRYFGRRPFAISFDLFILLWRIFAIFKVFAKFAIFDKIGNLKWDHWSFLISLVPKALAKFRLIRHFRHERVFPTFLIAGVWIRLYSYISGLLKTATVLFVCFAKCQPLLKPRASAKSISQKLTHFPGKVLHLALFRNKTWVLWSLQEWPISCGYMSGILFFSQFDSFQTPWIFYPWSWL